MDHVEGGELMLIHNIDVASVGEECPRHLLTSSPVNPINPLPLIRNPKHHTPNPKTQMLEANG